MTQYLLDLMAEESHKKGIPIYTDFFINLPHGNFKRDIIKSQRQIEAFCETSKMGHIFLSKSYITARTSKSDLRYWLLLLGMRRRYRIDKNIVAIIRSIKDIDWRLRWLVSQIVEQKDCNEFCARNTLTGKQDTEHINTEHAKQLLGRIPKK